MPTYPQYKMPPKKKQLDDDLDEILEPVIGILTAALLASITGHLVQTYLQGDKQLYTWGMTLEWTVARGYTPPSTEAINWARQHAAKLVTNMNEESKARLRQIIVDGIENKRGIPGLARDIRNEFADMSKYRSELIAKTETRNALWKGSRERMHAMDIDGKEWVLGSGGSEGNCEDCIDNAGAGIIPVDDEFPNPEDGIHPGCTCAIAPARLANREE